MPPSCHHTTSLSHLYSPYCRLLISSSFPLSLKRVHSIQNLLMPIPRGTLTKSQTDTQKQNKKTKNEGSEAERERGCSTREVPACLGLVGRPCRAFPLFIFSPFFLLDPLFCIRTSLPPLTWKSLQAEGVHNLHTHILDCQERERARVTKAEKPFVYREMAIYREKDTNANGYGGEKP